MPASADHGQILRPSVTVTVQVPPELRAAALKAVWMDGLQWGVIGGVAIGLVLAWLSSRRPT